MYQEVSNKRLVIDNIQFQLVFNGFHRPLTVYLPKYDPLSLLPLSYADLIAAFGLSIVVDGDKVDLNTNVYFQYLWQRCGFQTIENGDFMPVVLWWAVGGKQPEVDWYGYFSWFDLGVVKCKIKPVSKEKIERLCSEISDKEQSCSAVKIVQLLDLVVRSSIQEFKPKINIDDLDPYASFTLISVVFRQSILEIIEASSNQNIDTSNINNDKSYAFLFED